MYDLTAFRIVLETVSTYIKAREKSLAFHWPTSSGCTLTSGTATSPLVVYSLLLGQWKARDLSSALMYADIVPNTARLSAH